MSVEDRELVDVAVLAPLDGPLTYRVPPRLAGRVAPGSRVVAMLGRRRVLGIVVARRETCDLERVVDLADVVDSEPMVDEELLGLLVSLSRYYFAPIGEVFRLALPPLDRRAEEMTKKLELFAERRGLGERTQLVARALVSPDVAAGTRGNAHSVLAHLHASGPAPVVELEKTWGSARAIVKRMVEKEWVELKEEPIAEGPRFDDAVARDTPPELTRAQDEARIAITCAIEDAKRACFLLHGVTGSGKTEVYLRAIDACRRLERGVIVLVPEIALTPQLVSRYRARFGDDVAVLHSALSPRDRFSMWTALREGRLQVAIGARSALFAPVRSLGLIIVDEEHDSSFKQEEGVRYHARDMAILRAHRAGAVCVLGSATPSLESVWLTRSERATLLKLPERATSQALPAVEIVDLRRFGAGPTGVRRLTLPVHRALEKALEDESQSIVFLNRRGFAPSLVCEACGHVEHCKSCAVALTVHRGHSGRVRCHYCDFDAPVPECCQACGAPRLSFEGIGTERIEETLTLAFPEASIARLDRDVASGKRAHGVLERIRRREVDIVVGTQMVTKGHDLPDVTLVAVLNADAATSMPDFRASERAFHLLVQVAGRAGRGERAGRVLIQTYNPAHPAVVHAAAHDVDAFIERELQDRRELGYPPYSRLVLVKLDAIDEDAAKHAASLVARAARATASGIDVLGPSPAPLARLRSRYRYRVMLRAKERALLRRAVLAVLASRPRLPKGVRCIVDVDPVSML